MASINQIKKLAQNSIYEGERNAVPTVKRARFKASGNRQQEKDTSREVRRPRVREGARQRFRFYEFDFGIRRTIVPKLLVFMFYLSFLVILYIANHHYAEKTLLNIDKMHKEMKDLKADFYTSNAELSNRSMQSRVAGMVAPMELKEQVRPPKHIKALPVRQTLISNSSGK